ncbi:hypothetical protein [Microbacterium sp. A93]|uniref:hypothetical protein n=1 Tax=Microbacterium sp. A93 TaxID=3450716 RepID=UPI003F43BA44
MTETNTVADRSSLVPGAHRLIRAVDGREGPFAGALVTGDDGMAVCVDAESLASWDGWAFSDAEHICGVMDVRRRTDGHDVLLPWCTQRVETFLGRRQVAEARLTAGELGTLVVSLLRGMRELGNEADSVIGCWWLTNDGRPLFVHGEGGAARAGTAALVDRVIQHNTDRATVRILEEIAAALRQPRHHVADDQRWEEQLFALAAPRALRLDVFAPERAADIVAHRMPRTVVPLDAPGTRRARSRALRPRRDLRNRVRERVLDASERGRVLLGHFRRDEARTAVDSPKASRRRPLILAGSLAAAVLVVGLMWPSGDSSDGANAETAETVVPTAPGTTEIEESVEEAEAPPAEESSAPDEPSDAAVSEDDALGAVPALLDTIRACVDAAAQVCLDAVAEGARMPTEGAAGEGSDASTAALVDDYGDVAVIRLTPVGADPASAGEQMLVLERRNDIWLVRDVYDVAHQPE